MAFIIQGLDPSLFGSVLDQKQVGAQDTSAPYYEVDENPGFPCRITLDDASIGQKVALVSYPHHQANTPYAQSGPIFVSCGDAKLGRFVDTIPPALARRKLSLRAYDKDGMMVDAALVDGAAAKPVILSLLSNPSITKIDAHNAIRGCFAAHIVRHEGP